MTRLESYLRTDTSFGRGGAIGEVVQAPAAGDMPATIAGVIVDVEHVTRDEILDRPVDHWLVTYADLVDGAQYIGLASRLDFATTEQLAVVGRRLARLQVERMKATAR